VAHEGIAVESRVAADEYGGKLVDLDRAKLTNIG
jgi:hypothetical protein